MSELHKLNAAVQVRNKRVAELEAENKQQMNGYLEHCHDIGIKHDAEIAALQAENKRLREALLTHQRVEWGENEHRFMCSICWTTSSQGHKKDCIFSELGVTHLPTVKDAKL